MKIFITGATGLIGQALIMQWQYLHQLVALSRNPDKAAAEHHHVHWVAQIDDVDFNEIDAIINLAGEPIAQGRWTEHRKKRICESRWHLTEQLATAVLQAQKPPQLLINASAVGFYGRQNLGRLDENTTTFYPDFGHDVCARWENLANRVASDRTRVCVVRIGIVLSGHGGALMRMLPAYKLGLGGKLGDGQQYMSWIHLEDLVAIFDFLLNHEECSGIYNGTAPMAVTNQQFSRLLAERLGKGEHLPLPAFVLRLLFGEMADLLLHGQQVYPQRLLDAGFQFRFNQLRQALQALPL